MKKPTSRDLLYMLRKQLGMTETEVAEFVVKETKRPCSLRTVQSWGNDPNKPSSRSCPPWVIELLQAELKKRL